MNSWLGLELGRSNELDQLLPRMKGGDEQAWQVMFDECYPKVVRMIRRKMNRRALRSLYDSTDVANDVWKSLAGNWSRYEFETVGALLTHLFDEADCKLKDASRRMHTRKRDVTRQQSIDAASEAGERGSAFEPASKDPTASQVLSADETESSILKRLSEEERQVVLLRREGYTTEEISERIGWNVRRVQRLLQALERKHRGRGSE